MIQKFDDERDKRFALYRKRVREIFEGNRRFWKQPETSSLMWLTYIEQYNGAPVGELVEYLRIHGEIPDAETITRRRREVIEEIKAEEKMKDVNLSDDKQFSQSVLV